MNIVTPRPARHVLIVEDNDDLRAALAEFLSDEGFAVSLAENGQAALSLLSEPRFHPALVLLDLMMPVMDGIAFFRHVRADIRFRHLPVVVMTATPQLCPAGVFGCLAKPFATKELLALMSDVFLPAAVAPISAKVS